MNLLMPCIRIAFCDCIKKSTDTDYYVDPKLFSLFKPKFEPEKIQNKVSESEFMGIRNQLGNAGGGWFTASKVNYILTMIHAVLCLGVFLAQVIAKKFYDKEILEISTAIKITCLILPNIILQISMKIFMKKACIGIQKFFDSKNEEIYAERGINWLTCGTLIFIHLKIVGEDTELQGFGEYSNNNQILLGTSGNNMNAFEMINKNSNREILLNKTHQANQGRNKV